MTVLTIMLLLGLTTAHQPGPSSTGDGKAPADSTDFRMEEHRWTHRLLFVFASSRQDSQFQQQMTRLSHAQEGLRDRDLLLISLVEGGPSHVEGQPLTVAAEQRLRDRFDVSSSAFRVVLVGKDGTEKRRDEAPVTAQSIFETIDAMPMRLREMREDGGGGSR